MKKRILFIIMALLAIALVVSACGGGGDDEPTPTQTETNTNTSTEPQPSECTHDWVLQSTTATCTEAGKSTFKCSLCEETKEEDAAALTHDMQFVETIEPTCQEGGYDAYACAREGCDETERRHETEPSLAPEAHKPVDDGIAPTCIAGGSTNKVCELCGTTLESNKIPALGHTYERDGFDGETGVVKTAPTCEADGFIVYTCTEEGCIGNEEGDGPAVKTEKYKDMVDANAAYAADYAKLGHNYDPADDNSNLIDSEEPTCTTPGFVEYSCQNGCGTTKMTTAADDAAYAPLTHTFQRNPEKASWKYEVETLPTCITPGLEWVVCEDCGHNTKLGVGEDQPNPLKYSQAIDATGAHVYDKNPTVTAPTCTEQGFTTYYCSADAGCTASEPRDIMAPTNHGNGESWELIPEDLKEGQPFCKTDGNWNYKCKDCQATAYNVKNDTPIENALHTGYTKGNFEHERSVAPTCISRGKYYCSECETVFDAYEDDTLADATNVHTYDKKGEVTASTCSEYGYTTYHCDNDDACTATERRDYTPLAAHSFTNPSEDGTVSCYACPKQFRDVTTAIETKTDKLCTCGNKGTDACTCSLKVEFIATKVPDAAFELTADTAFSKVFVHDVYQKDENGNIMKDEDGDPIVTGQEYYGPALIILNGEEGTTYTITVYDENDDAITTYDIIVDGEDVGDANVVTSASGVIAKVSLEEVWEDIAKVEITASTNATVQMYYPI